MAQRELGLAVTAVDIARLRSVDDPAIIPQAYQIAAIAAERQVKSEHWVD